VQSLTLERLSDGAAFPIWTGRAPVTTSPHALSGDGAWLAYMAQDPAGTRLVLQPLQTATAPLTLAGTGFAGGDTTLQFAPGSRYLVYRTPGLLPGAPSALYSVALAHANPPAGPTPPLRPVNLGPTAAGRPDPTLALAPGGTLLLYVDPQHILHAAAYDGSLDLPLSLPGPVGGVWSLGP
jgi:hypothetical protein